MCVNYFGSVVSICRVIGWKDFSDSYSFHSGKGNNCGEGDHLHKTQAEESLCLCWFIVLFRCFIA